MGINYMQKCTFNMENDKGELVVSVNVNTKKILA